MQTPTGGALLTGEWLQQPKGNCWKPSLSQTLAVKHMGTGDEHTDQLKGSEEIMAGPAVSATLSFTQHGRAGALHCQSGGAWSGLGSCH